jgi:hypothetical protein
MWQAMSRPAELSAGRSRCEPRRRCRRWSCDHCGTIRAGDEHRKFQDNIAAYGGRVVLVAVTAPGAGEGLPWDPDLCELQAAHKHRGDNGCRVVSDLAWEWNEAASERYARMWKAASVEADRWLRRLGYRGQLPRRVANAWAPQQRGVWHVHEALPAASVTELQWSRLVVAYISRHSRRYGWGNVDRNPLHRAAVCRPTDAATLAARYLARNAAGYLAGNLELASLPGRGLRSYVSRRLTSKTGVTIRNLRRVRYLFVLIRQGLPLPQWPEAELELVWRLLADGVVVIRGP